MEGWHRSQEHPRSHKQSRRSPSPSPTTGDSTPPLLLDCPGSPVDALHLDSLDSKIRALETSPRKSGSPRKAAATLPAVAPSFSEPLSLLAQSLITLQNSRTTPMVTSSLAARHSVRFALEGVLDVAIRMSGTSLSAEDVLKDCFVEMGLPVESAEEAQVSAPRTEADEGSSTAAATLTTEERLTSLEKASSATQAAILERLVKVERHLKRQSKRSALADGEPGREGNAQCDCEAVRGKMERASREREDSLDRDMQLREKEMLAKVLPLVKQHREDLKAATSVAGDRFRKQALAQVQSSLRAHRTSRKDASGEAEDFLDWYCERYNSEAHTVVKMSSQDIRQSYLIKVDGRTIGMGMSSDSARIDAMAYLRVADKQLDTDWRKHLAASAEEEELEVIQEVSSALKKEKRAYEARLVSLGWRLEEDAQGLLYHSSLKNP